MILSGFNNMIIFLGLSMHKSFDIIFKSMAVSISTSVVVVVWNSSRVRIRFLKIRVIVLTPPSKAKSIAI
jgi:hypothetical protein